MIVVHENNFYIVKVLDEEHFCYGVIHREYETLEHKTYTLPAAINVADGLAQELQRLSDEKAKQDKPASNDNVVPLKND